MEENKRTNEPDLTNKTSVGGEAQPETAQSAPETDGEEPAMQKDEPKKDSKAKKIFGVVITALVVALIIIILLLLRFCSPACNPAESEHEWGDWEVTTAATCEKEGERTRTCIHNGEHKETEVIPALGHDWNEWVIVTPATCDNEGERTRTCVHNGEHKETEVIPALGHDWNEWVIVTPATCDNEGERTRTCSRDESHTETEVIPATGHDWSEWTVSDATECEGDVQETRVCANDNTHTQTRTVEALHHDWGEWQVSLPATCETNGVETRICKNNSSHVETRPLPALGHEWSEDWIILVPAECEKIGVKVRTCLRDDSHTDVQIIEKLGHDYISRVVPPTCTEQGYTLYTCSRCGDSYKEDYKDALGHKWGEWTTERESCEHAGLRYRVCTVCGERQEEYLAAGQHSWDDGQITRPATCTEDGEMIYTCTICGATQTQTIPALGHDYKVTDSLPPDCTEEGYIEYTCSVCGDKTTKTLDKLGHEYKVAFIEEASCEEMGRIGFTCVRCDESYDRIIPALGHDYKETSRTEATCTESGTINYTCSRDERHTKTEEIPAIGHTWSEEYQYDVDNPDKGHYRVCLICGEKNEEPHVNDGTYEWSEEKHAFVLTCVCGWELVIEITDPDHSYTEIVEQRAATCIERGYLKLRCTAHENCSDPIKEFDLGYADHALQEVAQKPATCTEDGNIAYYYCIVCGKYFLEENGEKVEADYDSDIKLSALGHDIVHYEAQDPTCSQVGWYAYEACTRCDYTTYKEIPMLDHVLIHHEAKDPTCITAGNKEYDTCENCDYTTYEEIPALGHIMVGYPAKAPTCTESGWDAYEVCARCGYSTKVEIPALGHTFGPVQSAKDPTCTESGWTEYKVCATCGYKDGYEELPATGHQIEMFTVDNSSTYTFVLVDGGLQSNNQDKNSTSAIYIITATHAFTLEIKYSVSSEANYDKLTIKHNGTTLITISGENYTKLEKSLSIQLQAGDTVTFTYSKDGSVNKGEDTAYVQILSPVTITATNEVLAQLQQTATQDVYCAVCGELLISVECGTKGHDFVYHSAKEATCTESGWAAYYVCSRCGYSTFEEIPALGHSYNILLEQVSPTCTAEGYAIFKCTRCDDTHTMTIEKLNHVFSSYSHDDKQHWRTCIYCGYEEREDHNYNFNYNDVTHWYDVCKDCGYTPPPQEIEGSVHVHDYYNYVCTGCGDLEYTHFSENLSYTLNPDGQSWTVGKGSCTDKNIVIPAFYEGLPVTVMGTGFIYSTATSIVVPDTVTTVLESNYTSIGKLVLGANVENIGFNLHKLKNGFTLSANNKLLEFDENGILFTANKDRIVYYPEDLTASEYVVPDTVKYINAYAFYNCKNLEQITLPDGLTKIDDYAFNGCQNAEIINIPDTVTYIGNYAFNNCKSLEEVVIPDGVTYLGNSAFAYCDSLTEIKVPGGVTFIGSYAFEHCTNLVSAEIEYGVTQISYGMFRYCSNLKHFVVPDSVTSIGSYAFGDCVKLYQVTIGSGVTSIGKEAFNYCHSLIEVCNRSSLSINKLSSYTDVDNYGGAGRALYIYKPSNGQSTRISTDGEYVFYQYGSTCYMLDYYGNASNLTLPENYKGYSYRISSYAFANHANLTEVTIPEKVTYIGLRAFEGCNLETVHWNATSCTYSGQLYLAYSNSVLGNAYIFDGAGDNLTNFIIGDNVTYFPRNALVNTAYYNDESHWYNGLVLYVDDCLIVSRTTLVGEYVVKDGTRIIAEEAFRYRSNLTKITLPASLRYINSMAFYNCNSLKTVINNSETITVTAGSTNNGYVGYYATIVYNRGNASNIYTDDNGFVFRVSGSSYYLVDYIGGEHDLVLPDSVNGRTSYTIDKYAFANRTDISSVVIPSAVTSIGYNAFYNCYGLTSVVIGDNVTTIGNYAFYNCYGITSLTLGRRVSTINSDAFYNCYSLVEIFNKSTYITVTAGSTSYGYVGKYVQNVYTSTSGSSRLNTTEDGLIFYEDGTEYYLVGYNYNYLAQPLTLPDNYKGSTYTVYTYALAYSQITELTVSNGVKAVQWYAFAGCGNLRTVYWNAAEVEHAVPKNDNGSPMSSGSPFGYNNSALKTVVFGDNVKLIDLMLFYGLNGLTSITIPDSVKSIGDYAFYACVNITNLTLGSSVETIGNYAFYNCGGITSIAIPDSVETIGKYAFYGCVNATSLTLGGSVETIGEYAFYNCGGITSITIPDSVKSIGDRAFYNCAAATIITLGDGVETIGQYAFFGCSGITSITIPENVTSIDFSAFENCAQLETVYWNAKNCETAGASDYPIFGGCSILKEVVIGDAVTALPKFIFKNCVSIEDVIFGDGITSIGAEAFMGCTNLQMAIIGKNVKHIGERAFEGCSSLKYVEFGNPRNWNVSKGIDGVIVNSAEILASYLVDTELAARYLTSYYFTYEWQRP